MTTKPRFGGAWHSPAFWLWPLADNKPSGYAGAGNASARTIAGTRAATPAARSGPGHGRRAQHGSL